MEAFGMYLVKSAVWLTGFTLVFLLFLRNERFFGLNRAFLLMGIFASIVLPFFTWHYAVILPSQPMTAVSIPEIAEEFYTIEEVPAEDPGIPLYWWLYIIGISWLALRLVIQTIKIVNRLRKTGYEKNGNIKLVRTPDYPASFSFFSFVFVNPSTSDLETQEIVNHERGHIQSRHWFDLLFMEIVRIMQWFNPFVWIYAHLIRQNHEYLADQMALQRTSNPAIYQAALLNQVLGVPVISLANSFSYSLNKKRFAMMKKKIESPLRKLRLLFVLPLAALVFYAFAEPEYIDQSAIQTEDVTISKEGKVKGKVADEKGNILEGAAVVISGTTIGTITDANGEFVLKDVPADAELAISYVGLKTEKVKPDFDRKMKIVLGVSTVGISPVTVLTDPNDLPVPEASPAPDKKITEGFAVVEQMPEFRGGYNAMIRYLLENVKYPAQAKADKIEGTVVVDFSINPRGKIRNIGISKGVHPLLDAEATRVVNSMPDWNPGRQNGKAVAVNYSLPIEFTLKKTNGKQTLILLDNEIISRDQMKKINPAEIEKISVINEGSAIKQYRYLYGEKAKDGVIIISSKKKISGTDRTDSSAVIINDGKVNIATKGNEDVRVIGYGKMPNGDPVYFYSEINEKPQFPGGQGEMFRFLARNLYYPVMASEQNIAGTALVRFTVRKSGQIDNVGVINDIDGSLKAEAVRTMMKMPLWDPGKKNGKAVDVICTIPFRFIIKDQKSEESEKLTGDFQEVVVVGFGAKGLINQTEAVSFVKVEEKPQYPGGLREMMKFIARNLNYPVMASEQNISGTALVRFTVRKSGQIDNVSVVNDIHESIKSVAVRTMMKMPLWDPGKKDGKAVDVVCTIPFKFIIKDQKSEESEKLTGDFQGVVVVGFGTKSRELQERPFVKVEQMPEYPGGQEEMMKFISQNIKYPLEAKDKGIQGMVVVQFVISKEGKISRTKVIRGIGGGCDEEAVRVLESMPDWIPGKQGGKAVDVYFTLPIVFHLTEKDKGTGSSEI